MQQSPFLVVKDPRGNLTQFAIAKPSPGRWRVVVEEGSVPVVSLASANGLERPSIDARVTGRGHQRTLEYSVKPVAGQSVSFIERGASAGERIGDATGATGRLKFEPAAGAAERRRIVALVTQDGAVRGEYEVARYTAPSAQRPGRPRALRVSRRGGGLRITWKATGTADVHQATVRLRDGRRLVVRTRRSSAFIRGVRREIAGTVSVRGLLDSGVAGRPARTLIAAPRE